MASLASSRLATDRSSPSSRTSSRRLWRNQGSMNVRAWMSSIVIPARNAWRIDQTRSALGVASLARISSRVGCSGVPQVSFLSHPKPKPAHFQAPERLLEALAERPADRHDFADGLHLRRQDRVGVGELLERPPGDLGDDVVDRRLEAGGGLAGDVVADLVEPEADGELGGDLGDREPGRLAGQRRRAADPGVHLDHDHPPVLGVDGELDVRAAGLDADLPEDRPGWRRGAAGIPCRSASAPGRR